MIDDAVRDGVVRMLEYLLGCVGLIVGGVLGYLVTDRRCLRRASQEQNATLVAEQRAIAAEGRIAELQEQLVAQQQVTESARRDLVEADKRTLLNATQLQSAQQRLTEQQRMLDDAQAKLKDAFAAVSQEALAKNNEAFLNLARQRFETLSTAASGSLDQKKAEIDGLLKPMQELLNSYQSRLAEIEKSRTESYSMLREQLGSLVEAQRTLHTQTTQLVSALRRPNTRGQWGEITLRRLVELAGMSSHCDYCEQASVDTEDGRQRPDMIVSLPNARQIIIDCKATLDAFLDASTAADEDNRKLCLKRHAEQVRSRARDLSAKSYWSQFKQSPEFVVMFLPGEAFLYAAVEQDGTLIEDSLKNRVIIATPTTLIALLKAVEYGWRQEQVTQNAEEIRKYGKDLYDRITVLAGHFVRLGSSLDSAVDNYNKTLGSLETRVLVTARKISELGARSDKDLTEVQPIDGKPRALTIASVPGEG